jgi:hypothetical protein
MLGTKKFEGVRWHPGLTGAPVIDDALAWVECRHWAVHEAGDHDLVMAEVIVVEHSTGEPLLYFRSEFRSLARRRHCPRPSAGHVRARADLAAVARCRVACLRGGGAARGAGRRPPALVLLWPQVP